MSNDPGNARWPKELVVLLLVAACGLGVFFVVVPFLAWNGWAHWGWYAGGLYIVGFLAFLGLVPLAALRSLRRMADESVQPDQRPEVSGLAIEPLDQSSGKALEPEALPPAGSPAPDL